MDLEPILNLRALNRPPKTVYRELLVLSSTQNLAEFLCFPIFVHKTRQKVGLAIGIWDLGWVQRVEGEGSKEDLLCKIILHLIGNFTPILNQQLSILLCSKAIF